MYQMFKFLNKILEERNEDSNLHQNITFQNMILEKIEHFNIDLNYKYRSLIPYFMRKIINVHTKKLHSLIQEKKCNFT